MSLYRRIRAVRPAALAVIFALCTLPSRSEPTKKTEPLSWAPPALTEPITINVSEKNHSLKLDLAKDYIVQMPSEPLKVKGGLTIYGGRNIVLIGGAIEALPITEAPGAMERRALYLKEQTGTVHIEGLYMGGEDLAEAINLDQRRGAILQLQNIRIEKVTGTRDGHHADLLQTWAGPAELRIDRFTGTTGYQGMFLLPNQHFKDGNTPRLFDFRNINIVGTEKSGYMMWRQTDRVHPIQVKNVWVKPKASVADNPDMYLWPKKDSGSPTWEGVQTGTPPDGDFVRAGVAGVGYVSPGYASPKAP